MKKDSRFRFEIFEELAFNQKRGGQALFRSIIH